MEDASASSSVVLPNVHEYVRRGMDPDFPEHLLAAWRDIGSGFSDVGLFWEGDDKLVVSPRLIDGRFVEYVMHLLRYRHLSVVTPQRYTSEFCLDVLSDEFVLSEIANYVNDRELVYFLPWGATEPVYLLLEELQRRAVNLISEELPDRDHYWTSLYFDSKTGFRELCASLRRIDSRIQIPRGFTCASLSEAIEFVRWFYSRHIPCVLKATSGVGGFGNVFLYEELLKRSFDDLVAYIKDAIRELPYFTHSAVVVEEMIITRSSQTAASRPCSSSVFMSGVITPDGEMEIVGGGADIRDARCYYVGAKVGKETLLESVVSILVPIMHRIGEAISEYGYRGHWGVNFMISASGTPIAVELNARRCGESHVYAMAKRLYGKDWMSVCHVITRLPYHVQIAPDVTVDSVIRAFERTNDVCKKDGVLAVPTEVSWLRHLYPGIGYAIFGTSKDRVRFAEHSLHEQLKAEGIRPGNG